jgi:hypothetical protein
MKRLLTFFLILFVNDTFAQTKPTLYKSFFNNEDRYIVDNLILSTDGLFFSFASCECGREYYGKGKWHIKGNKLYLQGFDSTRTFPNSKVSFIKGQPSDSVTIRAYDYFGKPMTSLLLGLIYKDSTESPFPEFVDKEGKLTIAKKDYSAFYLIYESRDASGLLNKESYHYFFDQETKEMIIHVDFAAAGLDREPIPFNYGKKTFTIRKDKLYGKGKTPAFVEVSY